jgi:hypothetical protein
MTLYSEVVSKVKQLSQARAGRINPRSHMRLTAHKTHAARRSGSAIITNASSATKPNSRISGITSKTTRANGKKTNSTHPFRPIHSTRDKHAHPFLHHRAARQEMLQPLRVQNVYCCLAIIIQG